MPFYKKILTIKIVLLSALIVILASCSVNKTGISSVNVSHVYNPGSSNLFPDYSIFHKNDSISMLMVKIHTDNLLYIRNKNKEYEAKVNIKYRVYEDLERGIIVDTGQVSYSVLRNQAQKEIISYLKIYCPKKKLYHLELQCKDMVKRRPRHVFLLLDKRTETNQNYVLSNPKNNEPLFRNNFNRNEEFWIEPANSANELKISYINKEFPLALPPFSLVNEPIEIMKPDSVIRVPREKGFRFSQNCEILMFQTDSSKQSGQLTTIFNEYYPFVKKASELIEPLRYLTTKSEYKKMIEAKNKKLKLDEFWLSASKDFNKARELIRIFYSRVVFANVFFSSHKEGWKTDRGMTYIIFGPPTTVYKSNKGERWIYGENQRVRPLTFFFEIKESPYTTNYYKLQRSASYKPYWMNAVKRWRSGTVYVSTI